MIQIWPLYSILDSSPIRVILTNVALFSLTVTMENFHYAMGNSTHSAIREMVMEVSAVGGLENVKRELLQYPMEHPEKFF